MSLSLVANSYYYYFLFVNSIEIEESSNQPDNICLFNVLYKNTLALQFECLFETRGEFESCS